MVVASLKPIPQGVKEWLKRLDIKVIDSVYPGGVGENNLLTTLNMFYFHNSSSLTYLYSRVPRLTRLTT